MANNPLDELVQTSSNPVTDQPVSTSVDDPSLSPMLSTTPSVPTPSSTISSTPSPATPLDNPLDQLISSAASTEHDAETEVKIANPVSVQPFQDASQAQMPLTNPKPMSSSPTQSAHSPASPTNTTTPNPLDSLISDDSSRKPIETHSALDELRGSASEENVKSTLTDVSATPILPTTPSPIQNSPGIMENPISLGLANKPTVIPSIPEHDIAPKSPALSPSSPLITSVAPASTIPSPAIKPATVATIRADQSPALSKKELEEKAKKLLKDSPPKGKSGKKPWILGLLTLLIVVGAAGGGLFAYRFANPETTDQRSQAAGICCLGGECNDGTTFGGDPNAWHLSCDVRAEEFCNNPQDNHGGVKRSDGACTGTEPNTCNDNTPADSCRVFVCPNGCGGDGNETSCDGEEPGAVKRIVDCDSAQLGNRECGQIDYAKNGQYCGVKLVQCGTDCNPNPTTPPNPTAQPSPTPPPPTQSSMPTATGNLLCTPGQTLGNLSYDIKLTNINPVSGFQQANFQLCIYPSSNAGHKHIFQNLFNNNASYKDANLVNGVPTWACYQIGPVVTQLTNTNQITHVFNRSKKLGNTAAWAKSIDEFAAFIDAESAANRINKLLQFQIKPVLQANGIKNDQFVVGTVLIHSTACVSPPPSPSPTLTPNPSAPPLACVSLSKAPASASLGSAVTFTCQSQPSAVKYEFRYKVANGSYISLLPDSSNIATSNLMITQAGTYTVECRACKDHSGTNCTTWGLAR